MNTADLNDYGFTMPVLMHHYTSAGGLLGILQHREIWLTDINFLNDASEVRYALELADRLLADVEIEGLEDSPELQSRLRGAVQAAQDRVSMQLSEDEAEIPATETQYVASFCDRPNVLSMWRGYADGASGYSIAFRADILREALSAQPPVRGLGELEYRQLVEANASLEGDIAMVAYGDSPYAAEFLSVALRRGLNAAANEAGASISRDSQLVFEQVARACALIKHPDFSEEGEVRLLARETTTDNKNLKLRAGAGHLVPHQALRFPPAAIHAILVGPSRYRERSGEALRKYLKAYDDGVYADVRIEVSDTPLV